MQVDPTLMNVGDGGTVSREISAPNKASASMVGNPPQTLPPEFRGDVTLSQQNKTPQTDCKTAKACLDSSNYNHSPELPPSQQPNNAPMSSSEKRPEKRTEAPKPKADGAGVFPSPQWSGGAKVSREESQKKTQTPPVQSVTPGFQCPTMFKPVQPVAFLPPTNFSSPLCKITLPPALGQIAALREASASQFQKEIQPQSSGVGGTHLMRTYPYPFSVTRTPAAEKKAGALTSKLKSNHSSSKNAKSVGEHKSLASVVASPAIALPLQHPSLTSSAPTCYTLSPTAAICCGSALASITSQSRLLNHVEKGNSGDKATSAPEERTPCTVDVPLDLSAKSKRPKCISDPPVSAIEPHNNESSQRDFLNSKRTHSTAYSSAVQYPILPNTHRNGSHQKQINRAQNHQVPEPKPAWSKGSSQEQIKNIPGTYVGVASPILASTLRGKDGKGGFADEFQSFAKQEFISIIDQGEHLASGGKKPSCLMKGNQHAHSVKHVKNTSTAITKNCPSKRALTTALSSSTSMQIHQKPGPGKPTVPYSASVINPAWQQSPHLPHQASAAQRKLTQGSPKTKGTLGAEGTKFQGGHHSPSKPEDDKWDKIKSPLSNLASIVKQQTLETAGEGNTQPSKKAGSPNSQSKQTPAFDYPQHWSVEKWTGGPQQGDSTPVVRRQERTNATESVENNSESQGDIVALQTKPPGQSQTNGNRMESKLAQVLEGETLRKESGTAEGPQSDKLEGMVASILTGGGDKMEKKTNGTKEGSPAKAKAAGVKQKKSSPKKPAKEKSPTSPSKKAPGKRKRDTENTPTKASGHNKQKKQCAPVPEQRLSAGKLSPPSKQSTPRDKISPSKAEQPSRNKPDRPPSSDTPSSCVSNSAKDTDTTQTSFPRLRRGRWRADEARLDLWGFATPSPPPPPPPMPPPPPPPPPTPSSVSLPPSAQPPRRPRGRPRSNPLPERTSQGKGKASEGETPCHKKRRRYRSKKYQTGEYITEKDKLEEGEHLEEAESGRQDSTVPADTQADQCPSPTASSPDPPTRRPSFTRSGSVRYQEIEPSPESNDKPSGKRKFKSKHLSDSDEQKNKTKRGSAAKRGSSQALDDDGPDVKRSASPPPATPKGLLSPAHSRKASSGRSSGTESPPKKPVPPEVRRLIVNKNAGETLLQRAARLGYQDVVQYCLEKDIREVNRRDNAGYTALHEASSRGWTQIVQMLLKYGADVNCSAQDGTRPLHDAVASDNLPIVWLLLNHGADPTLATYSGHTPVKLAHSPSMKTFLTEYFVDLEGRKEEDPCLPWDFYSSSLFETDEPCWDFLLSEQNQDLEENVPGRTDPDAEKDSLLFEFSSEPLLPCYHVQVSLTQGFCNWFLFTDVLKRLKMSARIFRARYPHLEVVSLRAAELWRQVSVSQVSAALASPHALKTEEEDGDEEEEEEEEEQPPPQQQEEEEGLVELVRCVPELQRLLGSSIHILQEDDDEDEEEEEEEEEEEMETLRNTGKPRSR